MQVRATQRGYYGSKVVDQGEVFEVSDAAFSTAWMEPISPLDHDGDGRKGGSLPGEPPAPTERDIAKNEAIALGIEFAKNIPTPKLLELIAAKKAEKPAGSVLSDDDKILKALEISGRTDEMTLAEAEAIIAAGLGGNDI